MNIYISTTGFVYDSWKTPAVFYPLNMDRKDYLKFYATKFDSLTIALTFTEDVNDDMYDMWIGSVKENPNFKFVVSAPFDFTYSKNNVKAKMAWRKFWVGENVKKCSGCKKIYEAGLLGCVILQMPPWMDYTPKNVTKMFRLINLLPSGVKFVFDFRHSSWWIGDNFEKFIRACDKDTSLWCLSTPYVENGLVDHRWAGNLPSTRVNASGPAIPITVSSDFVYLSFNGTYGPGYGSYDSRGFLDKMAVVICGLEKVGVKEVFCTFNNSDSTYSYPLPRLNIGQNIWMWPKFNELPFYADVDRPACLHDALRLKNVMDNIKKSKYDVGNEGFARVRMG